MIQVAIPIEPGNSGGPLLDMRGRVHGILTIKSLVTANLGFAVAIDALKPLLKKPNTVPMKAWLTIGQLDPDEWQTTGGSNWRQRAGRIHVEGAGGGFGGRSLCLARRDPPALPFEAAVTVKLGDEAGAAGLAFHADGGDKHYGFYPSNGKMRLTRFDGPDVFTWKVLCEEASPHYRPGEWNTLKVRLDKGRLRCLVNDREVFDIEDDGYTEGKVGVCKFRDTVADFRQFRVGKSLPSSVPAAEVLARVVKTIETLPSGKVKGETIDRLTPDGAVGLAALREKARQLEQQAARLKELAAAVHQRAVTADLVRVLSGKEEAIDLLHAALLLAKLDNDEVDVDGYRGEVERMAGRIAAGLPKNADDKAKLAALNKYLFTERGFHGSRGDYYNRSNSYLPEVIDDREGLPITLSVLYIELGRRLGLKIEGVGLPGHFVVRHLPAKGEAALIDVYDGGVSLTRDDAAKKVQDITGRPLREEFLAPVTKRAIVVRMLNNLLRVARDERDTTAMLRYVDTIVAIMPDAAEERGIRAGLRAQSGDREGALQDVDWLLEHMPEGLDVERLREFRRMLTRPGR
jgi:regulator of sirC expression with transglutaminase-like and TPR domain